MQIVDNFLLNLATNIELKLKNPNTLQLHSVIFCRRKIIGFGPQYYQYSWHTYSQYYYLYVTQILLKYLEIWAALMAMFKAKYEYIIVLEWLFVGNQHFANISRLTRSLINVFWMIHTHTHTEEHQPKFPSLSLSLMDFLHISLWRGKIHFHHCQ